MDKLIPYDVSNSDKNVDCNDSERKYNDDHGVDDNDDIDNAVTVTIPTLITTNKFNAQATKLMTCYWFYAKIPCNCCCNAVCNNCRMICVSIEDLAKRTNIQYFRRSKSKKIPN